MKYILIDTYNLFFRAKHVAGYNATLDDKLGMAMHMMFASANKVIKRLDVDHVVFALEGNSWRKSYYPPYKKQRAVKRQARTEKEVEEDALFFETLNNFVEYLINKTNCSVMLAPDAEGDDIIARFTILHPDDDHVILSNDTDFYQLISDNVSQYVGTASELITINGTFDDNGKQTVNKKTHLPKQLEDPKWLLFEKCIRGDTSDNIFSAYPGVRKKGTKNKTGLLEAFDDKEKKGYAWNNLMLQRWTDHHGKEHRVLDDYERNCHIIDLTAQPNNIIESIDATINWTVTENRINVIPNNKVNFGFMKFCNTHQLLNLAKYPKDIVIWLCKGYNGVLTNGKT